MKHFLNGTFAVKIDVKEGDICDLINDSINTWRVSVKCQELCYVYLPVNHSAFLQRVHGRDLN